MAEPVEIVDTAGLIKYEFPRRIGEIAANATKDVDFYRNRSVRGVPPVVSLEVQNTGDGAKNILVRIWGYDATPIPAGLIMSLSLPQMPGERTAGIDGYSIKYDGADTVIPANSITVIERS